MIRRKDLPIEIQRCSQLQPKFRRTRTGSPWCHNKTAYLVGDGNHPSRYCKRCYRKFLAEFPNNLYNFIPIEEYMIRIVEKQLKLFNERKEDV